MILNTGFRDIFILCNDSSISPCKDRPLIPLVRRTCLTAEGGPCLRLSFVNPVYNMSAFSTGYVKDTVASIGFLFSAFMIYFLKDLEDVRLLMVCILGIAFGMDALFTTFPSYHFEKIGHNIPTFILFLGFGLCICLLIAFRKAFVFR